MSKGLAKKDQFTQKDVPALLDIISKKIEALKGESSEDPSTTGVLLPGFSEIKHINDCKELIQAHSSVVGKQRAYNKSAEEFALEGRKTPEFDIEGFTAQQWIDDIKVQYKAVSYRTELEKLERAKVKLEARLSEEAKLSKDLAEIRDDLADF